MRKIIHRTCLVYIVGLQREKGVSGKQDKMVNEVFTTLGGIFSGPLFYALLFLHSFQGGSQPQDFS